MGKKYIRYKKYLNCRFCFSFLRNRKLAEKHLINHHPQFYDKICKENNVNENERLLTGDSPVDYTVGFCELTLLEPEVKLERLSLERYGLASLKNAESETVAGRKSKARAQSMIQNLISKNDLLEENEEDSEEKSFLEKRPRGRPKIVKNEEVERERKRQYFRNYKLQRRKNNKNNKSNKNNKNNKSNKNNKPIFEPKEGYTQCPICPRYYNSTIRSYDSHIRSHRLAEAIEVAWYKKNSTLDKPTQNDSGLKIICKLCLKGFESQATLIDHYVDDHKEPPSSYKCNQCESEQPTIAYLLFHMRNEHSHLFVSSWLQSKALSSSAKTVKTEVADNLEKTEEMNQSEKSSKVLCTTCNKRFSSPYKLKQHLLIHIRAETGNYTKPFRCGICGASFNRRDGITRHRKKHMKRNTLVCNYPGCNRIFEEGSKFRRHAALHYSADRFQCKLCPANFTTNERLNSHHKLYHDNSNGKSKRLIFQPRRTYIQRILDIQVTKQVDSEHVKKEPASENNAPNFIKTENGNTEMISAPGEDQVHRFDVGSLDLMDRVVIKEDGESLHIKGESLEESGQYNFHPNTDMEMLPKSEGETLSEDALKKLKKMKWYAEILKQIKLAPPNFSYVPLFENVETDIKENKFKCDKCEASYSRSYLLRTHQKIAHNRRVFDQLDKTEGQSSSGGAGECLSSANSSTLTVTLLCSTCGFLAKSKEELEKHIKTAPYHKKEKEFKCEKCGKGFMNLKKLDEHQQRIHLAERKYKCDQCDKSFPTPDGKYQHTLKRHVLKKSEEEKKDKCDICFQKFTKNGYLKMHLNRMHPTAYAERYGKLANSKSSKKPQLECKLCHDKFTTLSALKRHVQLVHLGKPVPKYVNGKRGYTTGIFRNMPFANSPGDTSDKVCDGELPTSDKQACLTESSPGEEFLLGF